MSSYIEHALIKSNAVEKRTYQTAIADACLKESTLVVLPTGMGKTVVALIVLASVLEKNKTEGKTGKILFLAPTKPLVEQHYSFLKQFLLIDESELRLLTGEVSPNKRAELWRNSTAIVSTPQVIENDLGNKKIDLKDVSLIIFDEAHRSTGNYSYAIVADHYREQNKDGLVLGMTASPGGDSKRIEEVSNNLGIAHVEIRDEDDPDVEPYVYPLDMEWVKIDLPDEAKKIVELLNAVLMEKIKDLQACGFLLRGGRTVMVSTKELLDTQRKIQIEMRTKYPKVPSSLYFAASTQASALKVSHAVELIETQGVVALRNYFDKLRAEAKSKDGSKASKQLVKDDRMVRAMFLASHIELEHPKIKKACDIVVRQLGAKPDSRIIVFAQYRDTVNLLTKELAARKGVRPVKFIGQAARGTKKGLKQKEQIEIIRKFKDNEYNVMCSTSIGEEGLDIPSTDLVVFYEPVPSEIRSIQRRGRTARKRAGRLVILITKSTRDEAYYWSSKSKERKMRSKLTSMKNAGKATKEFSPFKSVATMSSPPKTLKHPKKKRERTNPQTTLSEF